MAVNAVLSFKLETRSRVGGEGEHHSLKNAMTGAAVVSWYVIGGKIAVEDIKISDAVQAKQALQTQRLPEGVVRAILAAA